MSRKTKVIGFSLPPEIEQKIQKFAVLHHKTRSELMREMIEDYFDSNLNSSSQRQTENVDFTNQLRSTFESQRTLTKPLMIINSLIVRHPTRKKVLICKRVLADDLATNLTWCFPGAKLESLNIFDAAVETAHKRLGLQITTGKIIAARRNPDIIKNANLTPISIYIETQSTTITPQLDKNIYSTYKWVEPMDIFCYFSTSVSNEVTEYLADL